MGEGSLDSPTCCTNPYPIHRSHLISFLPSLPAFEDLNPYEAPGSSYASQPSNPLNMESLSISGASYPSNEQQQPPYTYAPSMPTFGQVSQQSMPPSMPQPMQGYRQVWYSVSLGHRGSLLHSTRVGIRHSFEQMMQQILLDRGGHFTILLCLINLLRHFSQRSVLLQQCDLLIKSASPTHSVLCTGDHSKLLPKE